MGDAEAVRKAVLDHIHGIFQAYLRQDREEIRRTHTPDWIGFQVPSVKIERGLDAYMANAERSLRTLRGVGYELLDTEVQAFGDLVLVYYVARYDYVDAEGRAGSLPLRSLDVYRREGGRWNQAGSHIAGAPCGSDSGEGDDTRPDGPNRRRPVPNAPRPPT